MSRPDPPPRPTGNFQSSAQPAMTHQAADTTPPPSTPAAPDHRNTRFSLSAWLQLARLSNLPTVLTNVLAGATIAAAYADRPIIWRDLILVTVGIALCYTAGMVLNDACDAPLDARHQPQRPIPSGRVARRHAFIAAAIALAAGFALLASLGWWPAGFALALVFAIVAYDVIHLRTALAVILLAACRGLVYPIAATAQTAAALPAIAAPASALAAYTLLLSFVARYELHLNPPRARWLALAMPLLPLAALPPRPDTLAWSLLAAMLLVAWIARALVVLFRQRDSRRAVHAFLAGFCLVDAYLIATALGPALAAIALAAFGLTLIAHRRIPGT